MHRQAEPMYEKMRPMVVKAVAALGIALLALSGCTGDHHSHPKAIAQHPTPATPTTASSAASVVSFRPGLIEKTDSYGKPDALVYGTKQLALLTWTMTCAPKPSMVSVIAAHHIAVTYATDPGGPGCATTTRPFPFTAVVQLPPSVSVEPRLLVTVRLPGTPSYTITARRR